MKSGVIEHKTRSKRAKTLKAAPPSSAVVDDRESAMLGSMECIKRRDEARVALRAIRFDGFKAVPWLEGTQLMQTHGGSIKLSDKKVNVIVGPNGSGKSAFLTALSLLTLTHFTGQTELSRDYIHANEARSWWSKSADWSRDQEWLSGMTTEGAFGPALYYRPEHIPGNECGITHAMMVGYFDEAKAYARLIEGRSDGQKGQALLGRFMEAIQSGSPENETRSTTDEALIASVNKRVMGKNWPYGVSPKAAETGWGWPSEHEQQVEALKSRYLRGGLSGRPLIILDEPERSLDALEEARLWRAMAQTDCASQQLIVATHSLHPLMNPERFNIIESRAGWRDEVVGIEI